MKHLKRGWILLLVPLALPIMHLTGCAGPAYYSQAISGHLSLMRSRVPISTLLADPSTDPKLAERLREAEQIRLFAGEQLGLAGNGSYSRVAITGRDAVTWNVVAAAEFSVDPRLWCFPVSGCVAYRGYFDQQHATEFANTMKSHSFDVMVSPAVAYSTLGWFEDPLLDTMLKYSDATLAGIMFHELAHEKLYVKSDTTFSEAFAAFVEEAGVRLWLDLNHRDEEFGEWERRKMAGIQFNHLLQETRQKLQEVYGSSESDETKRLQKSLLFEALKENYLELVKIDWQGVNYFANWMSDDLNNAHLALMNSYEGGTCAFASLYNEAGQNLERFYELSAEKAAIGSEQRKAWLENACEGFASIDEL